MSKVPRIIATHWSGDYALSRLFSQKNCAWTSNLDIEVTCPVFSDHG